MPMSNKIDEAQVRAVAKLARLELNDDEVARFSVELSSILGYIEKLGELDTDNVEPLAHCLPIHNVFREDVPKPSIENDVALANAPARHDEYFKVPKILDDAGGA
jgi:aspartyl-tRNA(Asn)/glutamyl-tRNA(Gln) amidotransferase subunit C